MASSGGQIGNEFKWRHLVATFAINAILLPNLIQVLESVSGSVVPLAMFILKLHRLLIEMNLLRLLKLEVIQRLSAIIVIQAEIVILVMIVLVCRQHQAE